MPALSSSSSLPALSRRGALRLSLGGMAMASVPGLGWAAKYGIKA